MPRIRGPLQCIVMPLSLYGAGSVEVMPGVWYLCIFDVLRDPARSGDSTQLLLEPCHDCLTRDSSLSALTPAFIWR